jgi:hypothetical protein
LPANKEPIDLSTAIFHLFILYFRSVGLGAGWGGGLIWILPHFLIAVHIFVSEINSWSMSFLEPCDAQLLRLRRLDCKVEIQGLTKIHPQFLSRTYLPAKIQSMSWMWKPGNLQTFLFFDFFPVFSLVSFRAADDNKTTPSLSQDLPTSYYFLWKGVSGSVSINSCLL